MARWEPDSRGRLRQAALDLYGERGFEHTTVAEIAKRAGVTERTFFRHFADKREVLFAGSEELEHAMVAAVARAPASAAPLDAIARGLDAAGAVLPRSREFARQRYAVIAANAGLRERELSKFASLSGALAEALRGRGLEEPAASLTAEIGIAVFRNAFERWIDEDNEQDFPAVVRDALQQVSALAAGG
jgi:AcrR family transcriptional regulator